MEKRELTYGERAVGVTFNPSGLTKVDELKLLYAKIIDILHDKEGEDWFEECPSAEKGRLLSIAIEHAQGAQMWAVKAVTA